MPGKISGSNSGVGWSGGPENTRRAQQPVKTKRSFRKTVKISAKKLIVGLQNLLNQKNVQTKSIGRRSVQPAEARTYSAEARTDSNSAVKNMAVELSGDFRKASTASAEQLTGEKLQADMAEFYNLAVDYCIYAGHDPSEYEAIIAMKQNEFSSDLGAFAQWVKTIPLNPKLSDPSFNDAFVEQQLKPWMEREIQEKGYSADDASALFEACSNMSGNDIKVMLPWLRDLQPPGAGESISIQKSLAKDAESLLILGLDESASISDVKKAYKKLALKNHPDKNLGDPAVTHRFQKINEAHTHLDNSKTFKPN